MTLNPRELELIRQLAWLAYDRVAAQNPARLDSEAAVIIRVVELATELADTYSSLTGR